MIAALVSASIAVSGCYTPEELRAKAAKLPDPRQEMANELWVSLLQISKEEEWELALKRKDDLILTTDWIPVEESLRKKIRCLIIKTPQAIGLNVTVKFERREGTGTEESWAESADPALIARGKLEERALVQRIYAHWEASQ